MSRGCWTVDLPHEDSKDGRGLGPQDGSEDESSVVAWDHWQGLMLATDGNSTCTIMNSYATLALLR